MLESIVTISCNKILLDEVRFIFYGSETKGAQTIYKPMFVSGSDMLKSLKEFKQPIEGDLTVKGIIQTMSKLKRKKKIMENKKKYLILFYCSILRKILRVL